MFQKLWPFNASSNNVSQGAGPGTRQSIDDHGESTRVKPMHPSFNRGIPLNMKIVIRGDIRTGKTSLFERLQGHPFNASEYITTPQIQVANIPWQYHHTKDIIKVEIWDVVDKGVRPSSLKRHSNGLKISNASATSAQTMEPHAEFALDASTIDVYRNADGAIIMYDGSKPWTFEYAIAALTHVPPTIPVLLLKNFSEDGDVLDEQAEARLKELLEKHNNHRNALPCAPANLVRHLDSNMRSGLGLKEIHASFGIAFLNTVREMHRRKFDQKTQEIGELLLALDHQQRQAQLARSLHQNQQKPKLNQGQAPNSDASILMSPRERGPLPPAIQTGASVLDPPRMTTSTPNSPARKTRNEVINVDILSPTPLAAAPPAVLLEFNAGQLEEEFFHNVDQDDPMSAAEVTKPGQLSKNDVQELLNQDREQVLAEMGNPMVAQDEDIGDMDDIVLGDSIPASRHEDDRDLESPDQTHGGLGDNSPSVGTLQGFGDLTVHPIAPVTTTTTMDEGFMSDRDGFAMTSKPLAMSGYRIADGLGHEDNPWGRPSSSASLKQLPRVAAASAPQDDDYDDGGDVGEEHGDTDERQNGSGGRSGYEDIGSRRSSLVMAASTDPRHSAVSDLVDVDLDGALEVSSPLSQNGAEAMSNGSSPAEKGSRKKKKKNSNKKKSKRGE